MTHAHVTRIAFDGNKATGVEYITGGKPHLARASRAVIVCAGALASPQLLMLSGVGPEAQLRAHGIRPIANLPGVGENFHDHPGTTHTAWVTGKTYNVQRGFLRYLLYGAQWLLTGTGPGSTPDAHVIGFTRSLPGLNRCDVQYHFTPAGYDLTENGPILFDRPAATGLINVHRPLSRGWIRLKSADPFDQPEIQPNLLAEEHDLETVIRGHKIMRRIFETEPMARYVLDEFIPGKKVESDADWRAYVRETAIGFYHQAGSCKMGTDKLAVVDERLRVHGLSNLHVADASIMPVVVSGNLNANCIMIGEKCADMLRSSS